MWVRWVSIPCGGARLLRGRREGHRAGAHERSQSPAAGHVFCGGPGSSCTTGAALLSQSPAAGHVFCGIAAVEAMAGWPRHVSIPCGGARLLRATSRRGLGRSGPRRLNPLRRGTSSAGGSCPCVDSCSSGVSIPCGGARLLREAYAAYADADWRSSQSPAAGHVFCGLGGSAVYGGTKLVSIPCGGARLLRELEGLASGPKAGIVSIPCGGARLLRASLLAKWEAKWGDRLNPLRRGTSSAGCSRWTARPPA